MISERPYWQGKHDEIRDYPNRYCRYTVTGCTFYIADDSGDVDIALAYLDKLEHAIGLLAEQPYYGVIAKHPSLRRMGFRMIIVENHLVFYKIRERDFTVIVYAVVDARQDYTNWIV